MRPRLCFVVFSLMVLAIGPQAAMAGGQVLPAGTTLNVRTTQPIEADYAQVGMKLEGLVDDPVYAGDQIVIQRGASVTLEVVRVELSSNIKGRDRIVLKVNSLHVGDRTYPIATNHVELKGHSEGKRAAKKVIGGAGIGAVIGGVLGGGTGAAIGAAGGGTTGAVVAGSGKTHLSVPAETLLQFQLNGSVRIKP